MQKLYKKGNKTNKLDLDDADRFKAINDHGLRT